MNFKGSSLRRAFVVFVMFWAMSAQAMEPCLGDTIIIDGMVVKIDKQVEVDTVWVSNEPIEEEKPKVNSSWELQFSTGARFSRYRSSSLMPELDPLEIFLEEPSQAIFGPDLCIEMRYSRNDKWAVRSGLAIGYQGWNAAQFDTGQLSDSLYRFYTPEPGQLKQITRIRFPDLGSETDTLDVNWSESRSRFWSLEIPVIFSYIIPVREWGKSHHFETGAGIVNKIRIAAKHDAQILLNEGGEFIAIDPDNIEVPTYSFLARAEIGWYYQFKRKEHSLGVRAYFQTPMGPFEVNQENLEVQGSESGLNLFFRFFIK